MAKPVAKSFFSCALLVGIVAFVLDALTKYLVASNLPIMNGGDLWYPYGGIGVFEDFFGIEFSIVHAINRGAAWGIFSDHQSYLLVGRIVLIAGVWIYALFFNKERRYAIPLALIISGAVANICDYFIYGHVIDMFHFVFWGYDYPVFNVADTAICIGVFWLVIASWFSEETKKKRGKR